MVNKCSFRGQTQNKQTHHKRARKRHLVLSQQSERTLHARAAELDGKVGDVPTHGCHTSAQDVLDCAVVVMVCLGRSKVYTRQTATNRFRFGSFTRGT